ncbi:MarR family winged helix-turn-helix transcriptional regulator [Gehongia tenuis]|uniref:Winged helix DNA-binding protein n=1 Tax=Gehongia tenuis TaxID=2763655 RepID=A0A926D5E1_9FIRM|nr:MarR family transcriptional regulator [Gehongia tenuis]MBC8530685.1 winged helix DNA-binding protein [Gehongia tenuis]
MLEHWMDEFYNRLALSFYKNAARQQKIEEIGSLGAADTGTLEMVYLLKGPTCKELADFLRISTPNLTYRVNKLVSRGYLEKVQDERDRRRYHLRVTDKFMDYYSVNDAFVHRVAERARQNFSPEELARFEGMFQKIIEEYMEETK